MIVLNLNRAIFIGVTLLASNVAAKDIYLLMARDQAATTPNLIHKVDSNLEITSSNEHIFLDSREALPQFSAPQGANSAGMPGMAVSPMASAGSSGMTTNSAPMADSYANPNAMAAQPAQPAQPVQPASSDPTTSHLNYEASKYSGSEPVEDKAEALPPASEAFISDKIGAMSAEPDKPPEKIKVKNIGGLPVAAFVAIIIVGVGLIGVALFFGIRKWMKKQDERTAITLQRRQEEALKNDRSYDEDDTPSSFSESISYDDEFHPSNRTSSKSGIHSKVVRFLTPSGTWSNSIKNKFSKNPITIPKNLQTQSRLPSKKSNESMFSDDPTYDFDKSVSETLGENIAKHSRTNHNNHRNLARNPLPDIPSAPKREIKKVPSRQSSKAAGAVLYPPQPINGNDMPEYVNSYDNNALVTLSRDKELPITNYTPDTPPIASDINQEYQQHFHNSPEKLNATPGHQVGSEVDEGFSINTNNIEESIDNLITNQKLNEIQTYHASIIPSPVFSDDEDIVYKPNKKDYQRKKSLANLEKIQTILPSPEPSPNVIVNNSNINNSPINKGRTLIGFSSDTIVMDDSTPMKKAESPKVNLHKQVFEKMLSNDIKPGNDSINSIDTITTLTPDYNSNNLKIETRNLDEFNDTQSNNKKARTSYEIKLNSLSNLPTYELGSPLTAIDEVATFQTIDDSRAKDESGIYLNNSSLLHGMSPMTIKRLSKDLNIPANRSSNLDFNNDIYNNLDTSMISNKFDLTQNSWKSSDISSFRNSFNPRLSEMDIMLNMPSDVIYDPKAYKNHSSTVEKELNNEIEEKLKNIEKSIDQENIGIFDRLKNIFYTEEPLPESKPMTIENNDTNEQVNVFEASDLVDNTFSSSEYSFEK